MNFPSIKKNIDMIAEHNGPKKVVEKLTEESVELLAEITKEEKNPDKIREELADVFIMCLQAMYIYGFNSCMSIVGYKIGRTLRRLSLGIYRKTYHDEIFYDEYNYFGE